MEKEEKIYVTEFDVKKTHKKPKKKPTSENNIHAGHRTRLLELVKKAGIDNLSDFQAVELFLTYIFPRGDVNPLAHRLIDRFGNFTQIVCASVDELKRVRGINERSAQMISIFQDLFYYYSTANMSKKVYLDNLSLIIDIVEEHLRFKTVENLLFIAISPSRYITHKRIINLSSSSNVTVTLQDISSFLAQSKPASLVVAHCHPYSTALPSVADADSFDSIKEFCQNCGVELIDSYIVGQDGVYSMANGKMVRVYYDVEDLKKAFLEIASADKN